MHSQTIDLKLCPASNNNATLLGNEIMAKVCEDTIYITILTKLKTQDFGCIPVDLSWEELKTLFMSLPSLRERYKYLELSVSIGLYQCH